MIEVKETVEPFTPTITEPLPEEQPAQTPSTTEPVEPEVEAPIIVAPIPPARSITSIEEDEDETEREDNYEIRQAAAELDGYRDYIRDRRGDGLNYGDW